MTNSEELSIRFSHFVEITAEPRKSSPKPLNSQRSTLRSFP